MLRLNREQRRMFADKVLDVANIGVGALIFGQALADHGFSTTLATVGLALWILFLSFSLWLMKENRR
jgi:hypothetical protein